MATKPQVPAKREAHGVAVRASTASVVKSEEKKAIRPAPAFLRGVALREAPGLSPTVEWLPYSKEQDQFILGYFLSTRQEVGPNKSNLYQVADFKSGEVVGVWGGTVLDNKMSQLDPQKGQLLLVQYVGDLAAKPGQNAARDFRVAIVNLPEQAPAPF